MRHAGDVSAVENPSFAAMGVPSKLPQLTLLVLSGLFHFFSHCVLRALRMGPPWVAFFASTVTLIEYACTDFSNLTVFNDFGFVLFYSFWFPLGRGHSESRLRMPKSKSPNSWRSMTTPCSTRTRNPAIGLSSRTPARPLCRWQVGF